MTDAAEWYVFDEPSPHRERERAAPVDIVRLLSLQQQGKTAKEAAEILGCATWTAREHARQMGVAFRNPREITPEQRGAVFLHHRLGLSTRAIAEQVGISRRTVMKILADGVE